MSLLPIPDIPRIGSVQANALLACQIVYNCIQCLRDKLSRAASLKDVPFKYVQLVQILSGISGLVVYLVNQKGADDESHNSETAGGRSIMATNPSGSASIMATNAYEMAMLLIARYFAFSMYPVIILVMFTKYRATQTFLNKTAFNVFLIRNRHGLHVFCGWYILIGSIIHTISHCLRWINQGHIHLLHSNRSGITGLIVILSTFLIVAPMTTLKKIMNFEMRKCAHYFFWVFCLAMTFHSAHHGGLPQSGYCCFVFPILISWYCLDATYVKLFMSERIDTVNYNVVKGGIDLTMMVSERFGKNLNGGFGYIMAPWISKYQWHPFSIYEDPEDCRYRHIFIAKLGDWTSEMHDTMSSAPSHRPLWISGPFPSPYNDCINYDNMIFVGLGVGITPAVSAIENYRESRRCNLIWVVREASMLVFFLEKTVLDEKAVNLIFYTGKDPLPESIENYNLLHEAHIQIVKSRPDIKQLIPNIINYFENPKSNYNSKFKRNSESSSLSIDHGTDFPLPFVSPDDCGSTTKTWESGDFESITNTCERSSMSGSQPKTLERNSSTRFMSKPNQPPLIVVNSRRGPKNISIHELESIAEQKGINATNNIAPNNFDAGGRLESKHDEASSSGRISFRYEVPKSWEEDESARNYLKNHFPKTRRDTWGLLYCGGRNPILQDLKRESINLNIPLHEEVFDW